MADLKDLKDALKNSLSGEELDFDEILTLSQQIATFDEKYVRFSIDASHVSRLGLELVAKQETAVAELVKNGYDADARTVDLIFKNTETPGGTLEVIDTGLGMTRQQLIDGFMRLSTADKVERPRSEKYGRQRAGRKGIGRFAAQRLGTRLIVKTQTKDSDCSLQVKIDWSRFEANRDLNTISNHIEVINKEYKAGTTLIIENLRDAWSDSQIKRAFRYVSDLLQPFPLTKSNTDEFVDPGFKTAFYKLINNDLLPVADDTTTFFEYALAEIEGWIDADRNGHCSIRSKRYNLELLDKKIGPDRHNPKGNFKHLPQLRFKAYYYIVLSDLLPRTIYGIIKDNLIKHGGIRLYRNGFRVLPYGEPFDDWLSLDMSSSLREILPPHRNRNFFGFVEVQDLEGRYFEETASREGLVENDSFFELQNFVSRVLKSGVIAVAEARKRKTLPGPRKHEVETPKERAENIAAMIRRFSAKAKTLAVENEFASNTAEIEEEVIELGQVSQKVMEENGMLRVLASLGLSIGEFTHEIRHSLGAMVANLTLLAAKISGAPEAMEPCEGLKINLDSLQTYAKYFDDAIVDNAHRCLQPLEIRDIINIFKNTIDHTLKREGVKIEENIQGYDLFTKPMHKSEWASILLNLFTNSIKAIKRAQADGKLFLIAGEETNKLFLEFADNGDGIPANYQDRIFEPFFTTSTPPGPLSGESEDLTGTGLGLKIVKDIIEAAEGEIYLVTPPQGYSTCFRIEIPKASVEEIPEDAY